MSTNPSVTVEGMSPVESEVLNFLQLIGHELTSVTIIHSRTGNAITQTVTPDALPELAKWIVHHNANGWNAYVRVGSARRVFRGEGAGSAPENGDIAAQSWVHVDKDMPKRELTDAERAAWVTDATAILDREGCTLIVNSGNGLQGWKRLAERFPLPEGDDAAQREAVERNHALLVACDEKDIGTRNVSRLLRIPGTINWPTAAKLKHGRVPVLAVLVAHHPERVYAVADLPRLPVPEKSAGTPAKVMLNADARGRVVTVDALRAKKVDEKLITLCRTPWAEGGEHTSRSEQQFAGSCGLVRAGVSDDDHFAMLLSPEWPGLSASVLDKGGGAEKYAIRQIERAQEDAVDPTLREMNDRYFAVKSLGGKFRICHEAHDDELNRHKLIAQTKDDFTAAYMNRMVVVGQKTNKKTGDTIDQMMPAGEWWLRHTHRRQFDRVVFKPSGEAPNEYNLWRGFACEPAEGDWRLLEWHIFETVCRCNFVAYGYLLHLMAYWIQNPAEPGHVAVAVKGKKGCGKGILWREHGGLWGRHYLQISNPKHLVGDFNAHLRDAAFIFADEAFYAGDRRHESILKTIVTEPTLMVEGKGIDAEQAPNRIKLGMASNSDWIVPATEDERRFFVLNASSRRIGDRAYFKAIADQMAAGGRAAMLHELLNLDLSDFDPRDVPKTAALAEQIKEGREPELVWLDDLLEDGMLPDSARGYAADFAYGNERAWNGQKYGGLWDHAIRCEPLLRPRGWNSLAAFLRQRGCDASVRSTERSDDRLRGVRFAPLQQMREQRDKELGRTGHPWKGGIEAAWGHADEPAPDYVSVLTGGQQQ
ncbi:MAG: hypothetical protein IT436_09810 [Phycisphaerales bacterium]|nr:hypothetical protein [Phycisphaerales bacterium]